MEGQGRSYPNTRRLNIWVREEIEFRFICMCGRRWWWQPTVRLWYCKPKSNWDLESGNRLRLDLGTWTLAWQLQSIWTYLNFLIQFRKACLELIPEKLKAALRRQEHQNIIELNMLVGSVKFKRKEERWKIKFPVWYLEMLFLERLKGILQFRHYCYFI